MIIRIYYNKGWFELPLMCIYYTTKYTCEFSVFSGILRHDPPSGLDTFRMVLK